MGLANGKSIGVAYGAITFLLVAIVLVSGWCWGSQSGPGAIQGLHDACLFVWAAAGVLLALSQMVFIGFALRMKDRAITTMNHLTPATSVPEAPASVSKVLILVFGAVILTAIALFVWALSGMPS